MPGREEIVGVVFVAARETRAEVDGDPVATGLGMEGCV